MHRHSKQRDAIRSALCSVTSHPTAVAVYDMVREEFPHISLATVYRNLSQMHEEGDALMLTTRSGVAHFDADTRQHSHFCCTECGNVSDVSMNLPDLCEVAADAGFETAYYSLMFYGVCNDCKCQNNC